VIAKKGQPIICQMMKK